MSMERDGVVLQGTGGIWQVRTDDGITRVASLRGRLKQEATGRDARVWRSETGESARVSYARRRR